MLIWVTNSCKLYKVPYYGCVKLKQYIQPIITLLINNQNDKLYKINL